MFFIKLNEKKKEMCISLEKLSTQMDDSLFLLFKDVCDLHDILKRNEDVCFFRATMHKTKTIF